MIYTNSRDLSNFAAVSELGFGPVDVFGVPAQVSEDGNYYFGLGLSASPMSFGMNFGLFSFTRSNSCRD